MPSRSALVADCRLPRTGWRSNSLGFPRRENAIPTTGTVNYRVAMVDFPDAVATITPQAAFSLASPGAEQYFAEASHGQLKLVLTPTLRWYRMSKPFSEYVMTRSSQSHSSQGKYLREALTLASGALDFSDADGVVVLVDPGTTNFDSDAAFISAPGVVVINGHSITNGVTSGNDTRYFGPKWLNHEIGHNAGLVDLYDQRTDTAQQHHWVGDFSLMGNTAGQAPTFFAWESWLLGWLSDDQILCAPTGNITATLTPIEDEGGPKAVVVPIGKTTAVVVESRRAKGLDSALTRDGALVYLVNTSINAGGAIKVLPLDDSDQSKLGKLLSVGQSVSYQGVTVTLKSRDDGHDVITVTRT